MARDKIVNKSSVKDPPKCSWFGYKYRVTPETSKLLQEAVFKGGGGWCGNKEVRYTDMEYIFVKDSGGLTFSNDEHHFVRHTLLSKAPPHSKGTPENIIKAANYVHEGIAGNKVTTYHPADVKIFKDGQEIKSTSINQQEESKMSNANNRRVLTVQVFDLDPALEVELSLVHVFKDVVTEDTNEVTLTELLHTGQLVEPLALHNKKRVAQDNKDILNKTGKKVKLEAVKVKNLSFKYV